MKVFTYTWNDPYGGGLAVVAANNWEEADEVACGGNGKGAYPWKRSKELHGVVSDCREAQILDADFMQE